MTTHIFSSAARCCDSAELLELMKRRGRRAKGELPSTVLSVPEEGDMGSLPSIRAVLSCMRST